MQQKAKLEELFQEQKERVQSPMERLFREYISENLPPLFTGLAGSIGTHLLGLVPPLVLGVAVDAVFLQNQAYSLPLVPDSVIPGSRSGQFWLSSFLIAFSFAAASFFDYWKGWGMNLFAQRVQHELRTDTYDAMQRLDINFFDQRQTGQLMSILNNDINNLEQFLNGGLNIFTRILLTVGGMALLLAYINWQLALVTLSMTPVVAAFTYFFVQAIQQYYSDVREAVGELNSRLENNLGGIKVIKASVTEGFESERVKEVSRNYFNTNWRAVKTRIFFMPAMGLAMGVSFALTFTLGGLWIIKQEAPFFLHGTLTVGEFITFIYLAERIIWPMSNFGEFINMYQKAYASAQRIFGLMQEPKRMETEHGRELEIEEARVKYDNVTFGYNEENVLEDINFTIEPGETYALVGQTGAGKSTITKLLLRFYDVNTGEIRIDGQDIREVMPQSLRKSIGYVGQESFLFHGTAAENISYGSQHATKEEVVDAAKKVHAHDFIKELENGYETNVGERGGKLSGGQKQRIVIARALLQDPEILILDEATSDVDTETERKIQDGIEKLSRDRTVLAIAHRLSTIKNADNILVLDNGKIVERGTHTQLLENKGLYHQLWKVQAGELDNVF